MEAIHKFVSSDVAYETMKLCQRNRTNRKGTNEIIFSNCLIDSGFTKENNDMVEPEVKLLFKHYKETGDKGFLECVDLSGKYFFHELFGTQDNPDFVIVYDGKLILVEVKSSKTGTPMWNSCYPTPHYIYLETIYNSCINVCYVGKDYYGGESKTRQTIEILENYVNELRILGKKYNVLLEETDSAINIFPRKMFQASYNTKSHKYLTQGGSIQEAVPSLVDSVNTYINSL